MTRNPRNNDRRTFFRGAMHKGVYCISFFISIFAFIVCSVLAAEAERHMAPGLHELPVKAESTNRCLPFDPAWDGYSEAGFQFRQPVLTAGRGWTADDFRFGRTDHLLLPEETPRLRMPLCVPVEWPGMRVETDYAAVAAAGRRRMPGGAAALAAAGLMLMAARKW